MKTFNLSRNIITEFMKKFMNLKINHFFISSRLLSHTNAFEKNIILTYQALESPQLMLDHFTDFVSMKYPYFQNKDNLFSKIKNEIMNIKDENVNIFDQYVQSNSKDKIISETINLDKTETFFDVHSSKIISGEYFDEFDCDFSMYEDFDNNNNFNIEYL